MVAVSYPDEGNLRHDLPAAFTSRIISYRVVFLGLIEENGF